MTPHPRHEWPRLVAAAAGCLLALVVPILLVADPDPHTLELRYHLALLSMASGSLGVLLLAWIGRQRSQADTDAEARSSAC
jgi:hypothetical protein